MGEFWKRTIFGVMFAIVVLGCLYLGGMFAAIMLAAVVMIGSTEIANLYSKQDGVAIKNTLQIMSIMLFVFLAAFAESPDTMEGSILVAPIFFNIPLLIALFSKRHDYTKVIGSAWLSMIFVAFPCGIMMMFYNEYFIGTDKGWLLLIFSILLIWINDIFAYLTGVSIGRHKLF